MAAISIVAYNGITGRANTSQRVNDLRTLQSKVEAYYVTHGSFPTSEEMTCEGVKNIAGYDALRDFITPELEIGTTQMVRSCGAAYGNRRGMNMCLYIPSNNAPYYAGISVSGGLTSGIFNYCSAVASPHDGANDYERYRCRNSEQGSCVGYMIVVSAGHSVDCKQLGFQDSWGSGENTQCTIIRYTVPYQ